MARDSWLKRLIWLRGSPAGGSGASYEKTVGPAPIISISDAKPKPAKSLIVGMEPIQAGSGDPSPDNIRPITGRTGVTVDHSGADTSDPQTYHVMFPDGQTVYGGTVDVVSGVLTVTWAINNLGTCTWIKWTGSQKGFYTYLSPAAKGVENASAANGICDRYKPSKYSDVVNGGIDCAFAIAKSTQLLYLYDSSLQSLDGTAFKTAMSGVQLCYELATPQTYQLTPTQIQMLKGANVLWSDADDLTLTYIGTTPPNLLGGMLGGGFGGGYNPPAEQDPEELTEPEATETDEPAEETPAEEGENNGE